MVVASPREYQPERGSAGHRYVADEVATAWKVTEVHMSERARRKRDRKYAFSVLRPLGQQGHWSPGAAGGEHVDEVGVEAAALQTAGRVRREQAGDALFAGGGLAS